MKATLPLAVVVAYLLIWLSFGIDGGGPLALWLPLFTAVNIGNLLHGQVASAAGLVGGISGFGGLIILLLYSVRIWRSRGSAVAACGALVFSIAAFATGVLSPVLTLGTAVPFLALAVLLLRREFTGVL